MRLTQKTGHYDRLKRYTQISPLKSIRTHRVDWGTRGKNRLAACILGGRRVYWPVYKSDCSERIQLRQSHVALAEPSKAKRSLYCYMYQFRAPQNLPILAGIAEGVSSVHPAF